MAKTKQGAVTRVTFVAADKPHEWNCSEFRCVLPALALNLHAHGWKAETIAFDDFVHDKPEERKTLSQADLIVVERNLWGAGAAAIALWREAGKTVIGDFDDAYHLVSPDNPAFLFWILSINKDGDQLKPVLPPALKQFENGLRSVHAMTSPSAILLNDWADKVDTPAHYLPNAIDLNRYRPRKSSNDGRRLIIGWGGSRSHRHAFSGSGIYDAARELAREFPQVTFRVHGADDIYARLPVPAPQKEWVEWTRYSHWPRQIAEWDIALAPMSGRYDDRRSVLRMAECCAARVPFVASHCAAYSDFEKALPECFTLNTGEAWLSALRSAVMTLEERRARIEALGPSLAKPFGLLATAARYVDAYTQVLNGHS